MKSYKRPQQGTSSIRNFEKTERLVEHGANRVLSGISAYYCVRCDEDWDCIARSQPDPEIWKKLVEKYGKQTVAEVHRFWNRNARFLPEKDVF
jgi:crotonobetainyl-CoA:carnitine CoA-transferase CaiB-like acyl-CoA transferase